MMNHQRPLRPLVSALLAASLLLAACGGDTDSGTDDSTGTDDPTGSSGVDSFGSYTLDDEEFGTSVTVTVDGATRTIVSNALPDHETGEFPNEGNPNTISAQNASYEYTTEPTFVGAETPVMNTGVGVNGVKFEPGTAETVTCDSGETYRVEALQDVYDLGLDFNNAHVQPTGEYHYHGISELLVEAYATDDDLVHVGFAADGYMMYFSKSGAYASGHELSTGPRTGTDCVGSGAIGSATTEVEGTIPDGVYVSDWVWRDEAGDLDACNGVEIDGTYAYIITDEYPYISRCLNGEATAADRPAGGPGPVQGGGPPPDVDAAAETLGLTVEELRAALPAGPNDGSP